MTGRESRTGAFRAGVAGIAPILIGAVPFGLIYGVAAVESGLDAVPAIAMSSLVFAGAAQLAMVDLAGRDAALAVMVATALVINARMLMYSASLAPHLREYSFVRRILAGYLITDQSYAVTITRFIEPIADLHWKWAYYLGAGLPMWLVWQASSATGVLVGASIPEEWSLDFAIPLVFLALLIPTVKDRGTRVAAGVGGTVAVLAAPLAFNAGLITGAAAGLVAGVLVEGRS
jgi:4-azaleucine resistance transporter AzlC